MNNVFDSRTLVEIRNPEPTTHPDARMGLTLKDIKKDFPVSERREPLPLKSSKV